MEETVGTEAAVETGSAETPETATSVETPVSASEHTPDLDRLVDEVAKNWDRISPEKRAALDRNFQPAFSRRVNWLNQNIENAIKQAGVELPAGKTGLDLVTENDGKGLGEYVARLVGGEIAPVKAAIESAQFSQNVQAARDLAVADMPEIKPHVESAVNIIEANPHLLKLARGNGGKDFYMVLQGVGSALEVQRLKVELKQRDDLLAKNKIAVRTAGGTTRAGAGAPKTQQPMKAKDLKEAAQMALKIVKADLEAET